MATRSLTGEQVAHFHRDGFLFLPGFLIQDSDDTTRRLETEPLEV